MSATGIVDSANLNMAQQALWCLYLVSAVMLPLYHVRPIIRYMKGTNGVGDACIRSEALQCCWRLPALLFAVFVFPSLPLIVSIVLDMTGRSVRVWAMIDARRRHSRVAMESGRLTPFGNACQHSVGKKNRLNCGTTVSEWGNR